MTRTSSLALRLREVLLNGKWIANTNFKEQILSVNREWATQKVADLNTIAALTFHINYYLVGLLNVLNGGELEIRDKYSFDLPPIESDADWDNLVNEFIQDSEKFAKKVEELPNALLDQAFTDEK